MKYKLVIEKSVLRQQYQATLHRSLLVCPVDLPDIKDLLRFVYSTFSFALAEGVKAEDLFLSTEDDFLLPPNAKVALALETNQVIKLSSVRLHHQVEPSLFIAPQKPKQQEKPNPEATKPSPPAEQPKIAQKKNRRKEGPKPVKKRPVMEISSSSSSSSSSESSSSEEEPPKRKLTQKKRDDKAEEKKKPNVASIKEKIRGEFEAAFKKLEPPKQVAQEKHIENLKKASNALERPYLNRFDHLLTQKQPTYDELFGVDYDEEQPEEERIEERKQRKNYFKNNKDDQFYNKYTEVFTKNAKKKQAMTESLFTSGGMLEVMNQQNTNVVLNLDSFVYVSPQQAT